MKKLMLTFLNFYKTILSPYLKPLSRCRFYPPCSDYTYEAIHEHGVKKGLLMGLKRLSRCNPFFKGGYDPVPPKVVK
jgi:putative membrane protein insertion efficiency factor